jgi:hypothetical protein
MGIFDFFSRIGEDDSIMGGNFNKSFSSQIVRIVCKRHEDGVTRCTKVTQSSTDPTSQNYEEIREDYDMPRQSEDDRRTGFFVDDEVFGLNSYQNLFSALDEKFKMFFDHHLFDNVRNDMGFDDNFFRSGFPGYRQGDPSGQTRNSTSSNNQNTEIYDI